MNSANLSQSGRVSVLDFGALGNGIQDDTDCIQDALDAGVSHILIPPGNFLVSNALRPQAGQVLEIQGTVKLADAHIQPLASDLVPGDDKLTVKDASLYRVGQWVLLCDEDSKGWNPGETRVRGDCGRILAIEGNTLQLDGKVGLAYRVKRSARVATHSSVILIEGKSNVRITGTGTVDANKQGQIDARPMVLLGKGVRTSGRIGGDSGEEIRAGCGIAVSGAPASLRNITIETITIQNANEHNICLVGTKYARVLNTICVGARDKNITILDSEDARIAGNIASFSDHEDGIMLHKLTGNRRILIQGNICEGNPRQGIGVGEEESDIHLQGNLCINNGLNLFLGGTNCSSTGDSCVGQNYKRFPRKNAPQGALFSGQGNRISNFGISGDRLLMVQISGVDIVWFGGHITGQGCKEDGCGVSLIKNSPEDPSPRNVTVLGVSVSGLKELVFIEEGAVGNKINLNQTD